MKNHIVSMTGFSNDPREQDFKNMISKLNMRYAPTLAEETSVLITKQVTTEKYKIAKIYENKMVCATIQWLIESQKVGSILDPSEFAIKTIFYGLSAHILGFSPQVSQAIKSAIFNNGGSAQIINLQDILQEGSNTEIKLLVGSQDVLFRLKGIINQIAYPIVGLDWLQRSIKDRVCKFPYDYAFNQFELGRKDTIHHFKKMKSKLELALSYPLRAQSVSIFQDTIVYIGENIRLQMLQVLEQLIIVNGGFYLRTLTHNVTHIITEPLQEGDYQLYTNNGLLANILRVQWLLDSIYFNRRMPEQDYLIRSFKKKLNDVAEEERSVANSLTNRKTSSFNFNSQKKSISMPLTLSTKFYNPQKPKNKIHSNIFQGKIFYVQSSQRNQYQIRSIASQITKNNGKVHSSRRDIKEQQVCYYVLNDSLNCSQLIETLKSQINHIGCQIQPVSYRWIKECAAKVQFIDILKVKSFIFKPFPFTTPIHGFHKYIFDAIGFDPIMKLRIMELYNALGSMKNTPNKSQITHCLCYEGYEQTVRYKQIKRENSKVLFLDWKWLIQCSNTGVIPKEESYLLNKENCVVDKAE